MNYVGIDIHKRYSVLCAHDEAGRKALKGGPHFKFTEAVSFVVNSETQEEIDYSWEKLFSDGGKEAQCGWLTDKSDLS